MHTYFEEQLYHSGIPVTKISNCCILKSVNDKAMTKCCLVIALYTAAEEEASAKDTCWTRIKANLVTSFNLYNALYNAEEYDLQRVGQ